MHYLYRYVCILNVFFINVYEQLSAIKNLLLYIYIISVMHLNISSLINFNSSE